MNTKYDIFISYRREGGLEMADAINQRLINAGYSVFLDMEQLKSCKFNEKLLQVISDCQDFLLILPPHALDRCNDPEDWVRREVECAMEHNKNIIPFMLRGFEWPAPEQLPESLRELHLYNAITANDHNVFIENIERLKHDFLKSKNGFTWRHYKKVVIGGIAILGIAGTMLGTYYIRDRKNFEEICQEQAMQMMAETVEMHYNVKLAENVLEAWRIYEKDYEEDPEEARAELVTAVEYNRQQMHKPVSKQMSPSVESCLRKHDIEIEEANSFQDLKKYAYQDIDNYMSNVLLMSRQEPNEYLGNNARLGFEFVEKGFVAGYLGLLGFYSTLPKSIYPKIRESVPSLTYVSEVRVEMTKEDCETMQKSVMQQMEELVNEMGGDLNDIKRDVELMERKSKKMDEQFQRDFIDKRVEQVANKQQLVNQRKAEMAELDQKMTKIYEEIMQKCQYTASDDIGIMWGKMLRMARLAEIARIGEEEVKEKHKALREVSQQSGNGNADLTPFVKTITFKEKYKNVDKWLVDFERLNKEEIGVHDYIQSARAYYRLVANNKQDATEGIIMIGTKDNVPHPVLKIGDIVTACNGKKIETVDDYITKVNAEKNPQLSILRMTDGELKAMKVTQPSDRKVLTAFNNLHEL